jgi:hypothetical protein
MLAPGLGTVSLVPLLFSFLLGSSLSLFSWGPAVDTDLKAELRTTRFALDGFTESRDCSCEAKLDDKVEQVVLLRVALKASLGIELVLALFLLCYCGCCRRGSPRPAAVKGPAPARASAPLAEPAPSRSSDSEQETIDTPPPPTASPLVPKGFGRKGSGQGPLRPSDLRKALADPSGQ